MAAMPQYINARLWDFQSNLKEARNPIMISSLVEGDRNVDKGFERVEWRRNWGNLGKSWGYSAS